MNLNTSEPAPFVVAFPFCRGRLRASSPQPCPNHSKGPLIPLPTDLDALPLHLSLLPQPHRTRAANSRRDVRSVAPIHVLLRVMSQKHFKKWPRRDVLVYLDLPHRMFNCFCANWWVLRVHDKTSYYLRTRTRIIKLTQGSIVKAVAGSAAQFMAAGTVLPIPYKPRSS